jgi:hypothetical protein
MQLCKWILAKINKRIRNYLDFSNFNNITVLKNSMDLSPNFRLSVDSSNGSNYSDYTFNSFNSYSPPFNFKRVNLDLN